MINIKKGVFFVFLLVLPMWAYAQSEAKNELLRKGINFLAQKQYDSSEYFLHKALKSIKSIDNNEDLAKAYINLSSLHTYKKQLDSANYYLLQSEQIIKSLDDQSLQSNMYINIAHINYLNKDFEAALAFAHLAEAIQIERKDTLGIATVYNNLAILYRHKKDLKNALAYNLKSLELNTILNDTIGISKSYTNIGLVYENVGKFDEAINYYKKAIHINEDAQINNSNPLRNLGALYLNMGEFKLSNVFYSKALLIEKKHNINTRLKDIYNVMLHNYIRLKDYEKAVEFQEKRDAIEIKEVEIQNNKKLEALKQQQELFYKEQELKHSKAVNEKNKIIMLVVFGLLIITLLFFLQSRRTSRLKRKQQQLVLEQKVLRAQMNPHFIFNALSAIQNSLMENNPLKSATFLSKFSKLIRQNFDFVNQETISLSDDIDALKNYIETQQMRFNNSFDYNIAIDDALDTDLVKIPPMLLQPFVENSIEHGFKNKKEQGKLIIDLKKEGRFLQVSISDNGVGFDTSKLGKGHHSSSVFKRRLQLLNNVSEKSFKIHSSEEGTQVQFKLDCA